MASSNINPKTPCKKSTVSCFAFNFIQQLLNHSTCQIRDIFFLPIPFKALSAVVVLGNLSPPPAGRALREKWAGTQRCFCSFRNLETLKGQPRVQRADPRMATASSEIRWSAAILQALDLGEESGKRKRGGAEAGVVPMWPLATQGWGCWEVAGTAAAFACFWN